MQKTSFSPRNCPKTCDVHKHRKPVLALHEQKPVLAFTIRNWYWPFMNGKLIIKVCITSNEMYPDFIIGVEFPTK